LDTQAATPTGAEASARADTSAPTPALSITERLKAHLSPSETVPDKPAPTVAKAEQAATAASDAPIAEATEEVAPAEEVSETAEDGEEAPAIEVKDLNSLSEATGLELDKIMDLDIPTKIDGKPGTARLRDLIKSHQLEGHLNQKLMTHAETVKAFEAETARKAGEIKARVEQVNQAVGLAQKILDGEFADVNWQEMQRTDPAGFTAQYGAYKMRQDGINQLNSQVMQEQERVNATQQAAQAAYLADQAKLLDSKVPEWADKGKRDKDVTEMVATLRDAYGLTEDEVRSTSDHRLILIARDAANWQRLQKSKPAVLQKVKTAPKLLKPGTQQSRATQDGFIAQKERERLRSTGKVSDAKAVLKRALFS
jgi:hypothetical protein